MLKGLEVDAQLKTQLSANGATILDERDISQGNFIGKLYRYQSGRLTITFATFISTKIAVDMKFYELKDYPKGAMKRKFFESLEVDGKKCDFLSTKAGSK